MNRRRDAAVTSDHYKKSPQIVGLRPPMCWTNFFAGKHNANPLNNLVAFATTVTYNHLSVQRVTPSATVWP